jgi:endoglucanase
MDYTEFMRRTSIVLALTIAFGLMTATGASAAPIVFQAENATVYRGVVASDHSGYSGAGFVDYDRVAGSYVQFATSTSIGGSMYIGFRFANGTAVNRPMDITVNGVLVAHDLAFGSTTSWNVWQSVALTVPVSAGPITIRATATTAAGGPNLDSLTFEVRPILP